MGLSSSGYLTIVAGVVLTRYRTVTDGRTDREMARRIYYG